VGPIARLGKYGEEKFSSKIQITGKIFKTIRKSTYSFLWKYSTLIDYHYEL
jgi:hypothetical protein